MEQYKDHEAEILQSWQFNAKPWAAAVRNGEIESRKLITDRAIIESVMSRSPATVLDLGCGEGWLARELASRGVEVTGIDAVSTLIELATRAGGGQFQTLSYAEVVAGKLALSVDLMVCNFSLFGEESVAGIFQVAPSLLKPAGTLIVQTLHPDSADADGGWRAGSWAGFSSDFSHPPPWYCRSREQWQQLFTDNGFEVAEIREPVTSNSSQPASIIFIGALR